MGEVPEQLKRWTFRRDGWACVVCGRKESDGAVLHAHHRIPEEEGGETALKNLVTLCKRHHEMIHRRSAPQYPLPTIDPDNYPIDLSTVDCDILGALRRDGASSTRRIARITGSSEQHTHRRLHRLMAEDILDRRENKLWDFAEEVAENESIRGQWPTSSSVAASLGRGDVMRRLHQRGWDYDEIATLVGIDQRSVRDAIVRSRALELPFSGEEGLVNDNDVQKLLEAD